MRIIRKALLAGAMALAATVPMVSEGIAAEYKVAVINPLTGVYAFGGVPIQNAMKLAIEQANASNALNGNTLRVIEGDTASEKGQSITLTSKMAQSENVLFIFGPTTSMEATAAAPVANEHKVPLFGIGSSKGITEAGPWSFKVQAVGTDIMPALSDYAAKKLGVKRVSLIFDRSNDGYVTQTAAVKAGLIKHGAEIVSEDGILGSDTEFTALATKLASQDPDAVFIAATAEGAANIVTQLRQGGLEDKVRIMGPSTIGSESFIKMGGKAVEGTIILSDYFPGNPSPLNQEFVKAYRAKYGTAPDNWAGMGYALASLAITAIKNAGPNPTRESVRVALNNLRNQPTIIGNGTWTQDEGRNPNYGAAILTVKNGKFELAPQ